MQCEGYMLVTKDIVAAKHFYEEVIGANIMVDMGSHVVFTEGFSLLLEEDWRRHAELEQTGIAYEHHAGQLGFAVDDIHEFVKKLEQIPGIRYCHGLKEHPWGRWAVRLYDPDGHVVEVGEDMKIVVKRFLRQGLSVEEAARRSDFPVGFVLMCKAEMGDDIQER